MGWRRDPRPAFNRSTGQPAVIYTWECPAFRNGEPGGERHDQMGRRVYDPTLPVGEAT